MTNDTKLTPAQEFQQRHYARCAIDPVFFITKVCRTVDEKDRENPVKPFPDQIYITKLINEIHTHDKLILEKSRQLMVTWTINAYILWCCMFGWHRRWFIQSKKEDDSDAQLSRIESIIKNLPDWLKCNVKRKYCKIEFPDTGSEIMAVAQNPGAYRSFTGDVFIDEDEEQPEYEACLTAALPITMGGGKLVSVGTAKGYNHKYRVFTGEAWGRPGTVNDFIEHVPGFTAWTNSGDWRCIRLHYCSNTIKDAEWLATVCKGWSEAQIQQEMEINRNVISGKRVYSDFDLNKHVKKLSFMRYRPLYRGWDFGFHHPAVVFFQFDDQDRVLVLGEFMGSDITAHQFFEQAIDLSRKQYSTHSVVDWGDPAGEQKTDKGPKTTVQIGRDFGVRIRSKRHPILYGIEAIRELLRDRADNVPAFLIDPSCEILIRGFSGGYVYEDEKKKEEPFKDGFYDHLQDALRYGITGTVNIKNLKPRFAPVGNKQSGINLDTLQNTNHALYYLPDEKYTGYGLRVDG